MHRILLTICLILGVIGTIWSQGFVFGIKGGPTFATQNWDNSLQRDVAIKYHGIAFIESLSEENAFALFAQAGYHVKGSAIRNQNVINRLNGNVLRAFLFRNISLTLGGKQKFEMTDTRKWYWLFGVRGDYTLSTNLGDVSSGNISSIYFPVDDPTFIREINYGVTAGAGLEFILSEYVGALVEFSVNPDFSFQYEQPEIPNITDPFTGQNRSIPQRQIRNLTFEITVGFRFLRKIEYVD